MNLNFWDGVLISSMLWWLISTACLLFGFVAGERDSPIDWSDGFDAGWKAAEKMHMSEIMEREMGANG